MMILDAVRRGLLNYMRFDGRASRREAAGWMLAVGAVVLVAVLIDGTVAAPALGFALFATQAGHPLTALTILGLAPPTLAMLVRRLHDTGRGGVWAALALIPVVGWLALAWLASRPGIARTNRHGEPVEFLERL